MFWAESVLLSYQQPRCNVDGDVADILKCPSLGVCITDVAPPVGHESGKVADVWL